MGLRPRPCPSWSRRRTHLVRGLAGRVRHLGRSFVLTSVARCLIPGSRATVARGTRRPARWLHASRCV
eukprot:9018766-Alexandrium_andersonii.AAC.1